MSRDWQYNVLVCGIGGQGILTTAQILAKAGMYEGFKVLMAEIHGMAQRGGRVPCSVRFGDSISSPTIPEGGANLVISLEFAEALTALPFASSKTVLVLNKQISIPPMIVIGLGRYPTADEVLGMVKKTSTMVLVIDAPRIATELGSQVAANSVMLGAGVAAGKVPVKRESVVEAMKGVFSGRNLEVNMKAYEMGRAEALKE
ncbi:MAG: indolepyruvate oxidoreductase subunit beta [Promethearchaeati archaeon SRVP18_Atabeyarchaeia-1]